MGVATNFFSSQSVVVPATSISYVRSLVFTVGDGSSTIFTLTDETIRWVLDIAVFNASDVQVYDWSETYGANTIQITFDSPPPASSRTVVLTYVPDGTTTANVTAS